MKILVITDTGCEEACTLEIARWTEAKTAISPNIVEVEADWETAITLAYQLQTARRVIIELVPTLTLPELDSRIPDQELLKDIGNGTFKVEVDILGYTIKNNKIQEHEMMMSQELIEEVGGWGSKHLDWKVNLKNPDIVVLAVATPEHIRIGIDLIGRSMAKREYRIMLSRRSLKATVAAATAIYAGLDEKKSILDPMADDGTLIIEAALLLTRTSPLHFAKQMAFTKFAVFKDRDWQKWRSRKAKEANLLAYCNQLKEMKAVRTNAKLAGVEKSITATRVTVDWMDIKLEEKSVDRIITAPPQSGKSLSERDAKKIIDQLFNQAAYILKKNGTMTCIAEKPEELIPAATQYGLSKQHERLVLMGKRSMTIITFVR